jgi:hypothetical protein
MYSKHLTYTEQDVYNRYTKIDIECVCPTSSGARDKQKKPVKPKGLTLVGLVEEKIFDDVFIKLNDLHNFTKNERLHLTMLGLFDDSRKCNPPHRDLCVKSIKNFFDQHKEEKFEIKYTTVRPGTYYPPNSRKQCYMLSDGTVIAVGDARNNDTGRFGHLGTKLAKWLLAQLPDIFDSKFSRKYDTVWSTLGYFDDEDFIIDDLTYNTFTSKQFTSFDKRIKIEKLVIAEFGYRNLSDLKKIHEIDLE